MKTVWARLGVSINLTDEEYKKFHCASNSENDYEFAKLLAEKVKNRDYKIDGECYVPECCMETSDLLYENSYFSSDKNYHEINFSYYEDDGRFFVF